MKNMMKKILCTLLACGLLLSLAACGKQDSTGDEGGSSDSPQQESQVPSTEQNADTKTTEDMPKEFSLDTTEVRLLCAEDDYIALAIYNCPVSHYGAGIYDASGNPIDVYMYDRYPGLTKETGLWLIDAEDWPSSRSIDEIGVLVTDANENTKLFQNIAPMTQEEMAETGLFCIDGYGTFAAVGKIFSNSSSVEFNVVVYMFCKDGIDSLPDAAERFQFYAEDGTLLNELFPDYKFSVNVRAPYVNAVFENFEDADALKQQLQECNPYMVYTGPDGTSWTLPLIQK